METINFLEQFNNFRTAVVQKAVDDYISGCQLGNKFPKDSTRYKNLVHNYNSAVHFFLSDDFSLFSELDGYEVLISLEERYGTFPI